MALYKRLYHKRLEEDAECYQDDGYDQRRPSNGLFASNCLASIVLLQLFGLHCLASSAWPRLFGPTIWFQLDLHWRRFSWTISTASTGWSEGTYWSLSDAAH